MSLTDNPFDPNILAEMGARQARASDPAQSAWVSANAGSGKTYVLTRRVVRLLLAGSEPSRILCLTFTKAAAANMANRIFRDLERWAALPDTELMMVLARFGVEDARAQLKAARRLFARAIETPGGLKVQTIHAFCESLLQAFPFEANVPAKFSVLDAGEGAAMHARARAELMAADPLGPHVDRLAEDRAGPTLAGMLTEAIASGPLIGGWLTRADPLSDLRRALGLGEGDSPEALQGELLRAPYLTAEDWAALADVFAGGSPAQAAKSHRFRALPDLTGDALLDEHADLLLTAKGEVPKTLAPKILKDAAPDLAERLVEEAARAIALQSRRRALATLQTTQALFSLAWSVRDQVEREKARAGALDFDDMIERTTRLLKPEGNRWVLFKLDGGLDHVLLDEAQDTSAKQWELVANLTDAFFDAEAEASDAEGGDARGRTVFAVGDEKQSIFSFQGARPRLFEDARKTYAARVGASGRPFDTVPIEASFRSGANLMRAVDAVFSQEAAYRGLTASDAPPSHQSALRANDSFVEMWAPTLPEEVEEPGPWDAPLDTARPGDAHEALARRIARRAGALIAGEAPAPDESLEGRAVEPGEILVLVRRRGRAFDAVIRELRRAGLPVAGADRLKLLDQIAVMDLLALARFVLQPEDDLTLAALLKSPLLDFATPEMDAETHLFALAHRREGTLWRRLQQRAEGCEVCAAALTRLRAWIARADYFRPFEFFAHVLGPGGGRRAFLARLGSEAGDALDEFLELTLTHEERRAPSLQTFLAELAANDSDIKRELGDGANQIRVMTAHGAKGLEARAVFLVCDKDKLTDGSQDAAIFELADGVPVFAGSKGDDPAPLAAARAAAMADREAEERRLLYVAMTRAKNWLYVCPVRTKLPKGAEPDALRPDEPSWSGLVAGGLGGDARTVEPDDPGHDGAPAWVWPPEPHARPERFGLAPPATEAEAHALPRWAAEPAAGVDAVAELAPTRMGEAEAPATASKARHTEPAPGPDQGGSGHNGSRQGGSGLAEGAFVHDLLQRLADEPEGERGAVSRRFADMRGAAFDAAKRDDLVAQVHATLALPDLAPVFGPGSMAEVPISGTLRRRVAGTMRDVRVEGRIDRLMVDGTRAVCVDFKTDNAPPETPEAVPMRYLSQMAAYRDLLREALPGREVEVWLVWTRAGRVMPLPNALLDRVAGVDAPETPSSTPAAGRAA